MSRTLAVLGERWTLLIVRDALAGMTTFEAFRESLRIDTDVLTDRLATLLESRVLEEVAFHEPGRRARYEYHLTEAGRQLHVVIGGLQVWGDAHLPRPSGPSTRRLDRRTGKPVRVAFVDEGGCRLPDEEFDVVGRAGQGRVGHQMHREGGDVGGLDDPADREPLAEFVLPGRQAFADKGGRQGSVDEGGAGLGQVDDGEWGVVGATRGYHHVVDRSVDGVEEPGERGVVGDVDGLGSARSDQLGRLLQAVGVAAGQQDGRALIAGRYGGLQSDTELPPSTTTTRPARAGARPARVGDSDMMSSPFAMGRTSQLAGAQVWRAASAPCQRAVWKRMPAVANSAPTTAPTVMAAASGACSQ
jgi:DNA-binding HxlR family transcriptional regulator